MFTIYILLLDEGTRVYRPVPAIKEREGVCIVDGAELYDQDNEVWEFPPGARVGYKQEELDGEWVYVATGLV